MIIKTTVVAPVPTEEPRLPHSSGSAIGECDRAIRIISSLLPRDQEVMNGCTIRTLQTASVSASASDRQVERPQRMEERARRK